MTKITLNEVFPNHYQLSIDGRHLYMSSEKLRELVQIINGRLNKT